LYLEQIVFAKILPQRFVTPNNLVLDVIATDERAAHDFVKCRANTDIPPFVL
jgi:hypothetical protein